MNPCLVRQWRVNGVLPVQILKQKNTAERGMIEKEMQKKQPIPQKNDKPHVWDLVLQDMVNRDKLGFKRYGTHLQPNNGRDALQDLYEELLDAVVYLRQVIYERDQQHRIKYPTTTNFEMLPENHKP